MNNEATKLYLALDRAVDLLYEATEFNPKLLRGVPGTHITSLEDLEDYIDQQLSELNDVLEDHKHLDPDQ